MKGGEERVEEVGVVKLDGELEVVLMSVVASLVIPSNSYQYLPYVPGYKFQDSDLQRHHHSKLDPISD